SARDDRVEARVALGEAALHAAGNHAVAGLQRGVDGVDLEAGAVVAEVDEPERLDRDDVRVPEELERLDRELVGPHGVEGPAEAVRLAAGLGLLEGPAAAGDEVPLGDVGL